MHTLTLFLLLCFGFVNHAICLVDALPKHRQSSSTSTWLALILNLSGFHLDSPPFLGPFPFSESGDFYPLLHTPPPNFSSSHPLPLPLLPLLPFLLCPPPLSLLTLLLLLPLLLLLIYCESSHACTCHSVQVEVREPLSGVDSFLAPCRAWGFELKLSGLIASPLVTS